MSTSVVVNTYTHTSTYVASKLLLSIKEIVRASGLDPSTLSDQWETLERGISTWLESRHLRTVTLEIFTASTRTLVKRWDLDIIYGYTGDGTLWTDTDALRYSILKAGAVPSLCSYRVVVRTAPGEPTIAGWSDTTFLSTESFTRYAVGSSIGGNGIGANAAYWVKS
jgi:hypothetical protein